MLLRPTAAASRPRVGTAAGSANKGVAVLQIKASPSWWQATRACVSCARRRRETGDCWTNTAPCGAVSNTWSQQNQEPSSSSVAGLTGPSGGRGAWGSFSSHNNNNSYIALYSVQIYKLSALFIINIKTRLTIKKKKKKKSTSTINDNKNHRRFSVLRILSKVYRLILNAKSVLCHVF